MPGNYKKRRSPHGPNKNEQKVMRGKTVENQARRYGVLGARFPFVKNLRLAVTFLDARQNSLDEKMLALGPVDVALLSMACPGRCGRGSFDFDAGIAGVINARLALGQGSVKCQETLYAGSAESCGCEAKWRLDVDYLPAPAAVESRIAPPAS